MDNKRFWCEFLDLYRELPALWQIKSVDYSNRTLKTSSYQKVIEKFKEMYPEANREMAVKKINSFRTAYRKELKKVKESQKSGAGTDDIYEPTLWYFDRLSFLEDQEECIEGISTMENKKEEQKIAPRTKKQKMTDEDQLIQLACNKLQSTGSTNCELDMLGKSWASQYQEMNEQQKVIARKLISDILYHGCMGTLQKNHALEIQNFLLASPFNPPTKYSNASSPECIVADNMLDFSEQELPMTSPETFSNHRGSDAFMKALPKSINSK